ncbi:hypothetical protein LCGC14_1617140, partial [marine sediment metagenome]
MSFAITGKTAIVTGAANGVGLAIARRFLDHGANVMMADMDESRLNSEIGNLSDEKGAARSFIGDLREKLTVANLLSATLDAFDRVDILVNASRQMVVSDPLDPEDDSLDTMLEQNLMTSLRLTRLVARRMIRQAEDNGLDGDPAGTIINLSVLRELGPVLAGLTLAGRVGGGLTAELGTM